MRGVAPVFLAAAGLLLRPGYTDTPPPHGARASGFVVYSQAVAGDERPGYGRPQPVPGSRRVRWLGYDLFMQRVPAGRPVQLTDHRRSRQMGAVIETPLIDSTGTYVGFLASRKGARAEDRASRLLWLINLRTHSCSPVRLPGSVMDFTWSPAGTAMAVDVQTKNGARLMILEARTGDVRTAFGHDDRNVGLWAWAGPRGMILYEDRREPTLLLRSVRSNRVLAKWREPAGVTVLNLSPAPDGRHLLALTSGGLFEAGSKEPFRPIRQPGGVLAENGLVWSPNSRLLALHVFSYSPEVSGALPTGTDHVLLVRALQMPHRQTPLLSWADMVAPPWTYGILAWSRDSRDLLVTHNLSSGNDFRPEVRAYRLKTKSSVKLFEAKAPLIALCCYTY